MTHKLIILAMVWAFCSCGCSAQSVGKIILQACDERDQPIDKAEAIVDFVLPKSSTGWSGVKDVAQEGKTDEKGIFTAESPTFQEVYLSAKKTGYYTELASYRFGQESNGKWAPWGPTVKLRLRKILTPCPMYVKELSMMHLPEMNKPIGYDLLVGDWVSPYGKGVDVDILMTSKMALQGDREFDFALTLEFPRPGDGVAALAPEDEHPQSDFIWPREAPAEGYQSKLEILMARHLGQMELRTNSLGGKHFYMRVRSELDSTGSVKRAMYGKILGPIQLSAILVKDIRFTFTYYVNPDNTRNLEFDPERNLLATGKWQTRYAP